MSYPWDKERNVEDGQRQHSRRRRARLHGESDNEELEPFPMVTSVRNQEDDVFEGGAFEAGMQELQEIVNPPSVRADEVRMFNYPDVGQRLNESAQLQERNRWDEDHSAPVSSREDDAFHSLVEDADFNAVQGFKNIDSERIAEIEVLDVRRPRRPRLHGERDNEELEPFPMMPSVRNQQDDVFEGDAFEAEMQELQEIVNPLSVSTDEVRMFNYPDVGQRLNESAQLQERNRWDEDHSAPISSREDDAFHSLVEDADFNAVRGFKNIDSERMAEIEVNRWNEDHAAPVSNREDDARHSLVEDADYNAVRGFEDIMNEGMAERFHSLVGDADYNAVRGLEDIMNDSERMADMHRPLTIAIDEERRFESWRQGDTRDAESGRLLMARPPSVRVDERNYDIQQQENEKIMQTIRRFYDTREEERSKEDHEYNDVQQEYNIMNDSERMAEMHRPLTIAIDEERRFESRRQDDTRVAESGRLLMARPPSVRVDEHNYDIQQQENEKIMQTIRKFYDTREEERSKEDHEYNDVQQEDGVTLDSILSYINNEDQTVDETETTLESTLDIQGKEYNADIAQAGMPIVEDVENEERGTQGLRTPTFAIDEESSFEPVREYPTYDAESGRFDMVRPPSVRVVNEERFNQDNEYMQQQQEEPDYHADMDEMEQVFKNALSETNQLLERDIMFDEIIGQEQEAVEEIIDELGKGSEAWIWPGADGQTQSSRPRRTRLDGQRDNGELEPFPIMPSTRGLEDYVFDDNLAEDEQFEMMPSTRSLDDDAFHPNIIEDEELAADVAAKLAERERLVYERINRQKQHSRPRRPRLYGERANEELEQFPIMPSVSSQEDDVFGFNLEEREPVPITPSVRSREDDAFNFNLEEQLSSSSEEEEFPLSISSSGEEGDAFDFNLEEREQFPIMPSVRSQKDDAAHIRKTQERINEDRGLKRRGLFEDELDDAIEGPAPAQMSRLQSISENAVAKNKKPGVLLMDERLHEINIKYTELIKEEIFNEAQRKLEEETRIARRESLKSLQPSKAQPVSRQVLLKHKTERQTDARRRIEATKKHNQKLTDLKHQMLKDLNVEKKEILKEAKAKKGPSDADLAKFAGQIMSSQSKRPGKIQTRQTQINIKYQATLQMKKKKEQNRARQANLRKQEKQSNLQLKSPWSEKRTSAVGPNKNDHKQRRQEGYRKATEKKQAEERRAAEQKQEEQRNKEQRKPEKKQEEQKKQEKTERKKSESKGWKTPGADEHKSKWGDVTKEYKDKYM